MGRKLAPGQKLAKPPVEDAVTEPIAGEHDVPFESVFESKVALARSKLGRYALWTVVALLLWLGVKSLISNPHSHTAAPAPARPTVAAAVFPSSTGQAVAAAFTSAYLTFDQEAPAAHSAALATLVTTAMPAAGGWNGKGRQQSLTVTPSAIHSSSATSGTVDVEAFVQPYVGSAVPAVRRCVRKVCHITPASTSWTPGTAGWVELAVPVTVTSGRVVVSATPTFTALDTTLAVPAQTTPTADAPVTAATAPLATAFFTAYATATAPSGLAAQTAPGTSITPLAGALAFGGVTSWTVPAGGTTRTATAVVSWQTPSGAVLAQTYRLRLVSLGGTASTGKWFVAGVNPQ